MSAAAWWLPALEAGVCVLAVAVHARRHGWRLAIVEVLLGACVGQVLLLHLTLVLPVPIRVAAPLAWASAGALYAWIGLRLGVARVRRHQALTALAVAPAPALVAVWFAVARWRSGSGWISWGMHNDVAHKSLGTRWILQDDGIRAVRDQVDPLVGAVNAILSSPAVEHRPLGAVMNEIVRASEQAWLGWWLLLSALVAVAALSSRLRWSTVLAATLAGLLPWTWFYSGTAVLYGFQNVGPAMVVLFSCWLAFERANVHPVAALNALLLGGVAAAMSWAPLILFPGAFLVLVVLREHRVLLRRPRALVAPAVTLAVAAIYGIGVVLPQLTGDSNGGSLTNDGAIQHLGPVLSAVVAVIALTIALVGVRGRRDLVLGLLVAAGAGAVAVVYLLFVRRHSAFLWGYYPIKFTWIAVGTLFLVAATRLIHHARGRLGLGALAAPLLVLGGAAAMSPLPASQASASWWTPYAVATDRVNDPAAADLFRILDSHPKSFVTRFSPGQTGLEQDQFINLWSLQMTAQALTDPIRFSAYQFDSNQPETACHVIEVWGSGVEVWTSVRSVAAVIRRTCATGNYRIRVTH